MLRGLAIQIAEQEENFYCRSGKGLTALVENDYSGCTRLFLKDNELNSFPKSLTASEICSLFMGGNNITEIPKKVKGDREYDLSEGSGFGWHVGRVIAKECRVFETASMLEITKRSHQKVSSSC